MSKFWGPFFFAAAVFAVLAFLSNLFDNLKYFINTSASYGEITLYLASVIPFWVLITLPVASLLASLYVFSDMVSYGEFTAGLASGYSRRQIYIPVMFCVCLVSVVNFMLQETVSPALHKKAETVFKTKIRGKKDWIETVKKNIVVKISDNSFLTAKTLDLKNKSMDRVIISRYERGKILSQTDADNAIWDEKIQRWVLYEIVTRKFAKKAEVKESKIKKQVSDLDIAPENLVIEKVWPEDLTIKDILKRIKALKKVKLPQNREITYLNAKIAFPFVSVIMCMLAIPFALTIKKGGKMAHFAFSILIAFFFWWIISVFQSAGEASMINPVLAGWAPVAIFLVVAFAGIKFSEK